MTTSTRREFLKGLGMAAFVTLPGRRRSPGRSRKGSSGLLFTSAGKTCLIRVDGGGFRTFDFSVPDQATWQPGPLLGDGRRMIFLSMETRRDGPGRSFEEYYTQTPTHLWVYDLEKDSLSEIATRDRLAVFYTPQLLLKDGRMLVQVVRNKVGQVYNINLDGSDAREFTKAGEGLPYGFSLRPDGKRVAFHLASPSGYQVWTSDSWGGNRQLVVGHPDHLYFAPAWSPDGTWLAFEDCRYKDDPGHDWADVCVAREDGTGFRVLTEGQLQWFGATYGNPQNKGGGSNVVTWTHDGRILLVRKLPGSKVAWQYQVGKPDVDHFNREYQPDLARGGTEIVRLDPRDGSMKSLSGSDRPAWDFRATESPDGRWVAFCRCATGESPALWVMRSDGSSPRMLSQGIDGRGADHPRWY